MKRLLKSAVFSVGQRSVVLPWLANLAAFNVAATAYLPSRFRDGARDYGAQAGLIGSQPTAADHNDHGLNFFSRVILEHRYDFVIELGALTLDRARALARLFPQTRIFALDITRDFTDTRTLDGVTVGPNTLTHIREIALGCRRGLIVAHGTLCCYPPDDLAALFATAHELRLDLAFSEPNTIGEESLTCSLKRTQMSWYHPYLHMLRAAGYELPDNRGKQVRDSVSKYAEERTFIFARYPQEIEKVRSVRI